MDSTRARTLTRAKRSGGIPSRFERNVRKATFRFCIGGHGVPRSIDRRRERMEVHVVRTRRVVHEVDVSLSRFRVRRIPRSHADIFGTKTPTRHRKAHLLVCRKDGWNACVFVVHAIQREKRLHLVRSNDVVLFVGRHVGPFVVPRNGVGRRACVGSRTITTRVSRV